MPSVLTRRLAAGLATAATAGVLAGCGGGSDDGATTAADATTTAASTAAAAASGADATTASASTSAYKDGTYDAEGSYQSPGGTESIGVSLTLADGAVTAVTVTPKATDPNGERFQGEFKDGISSEVVGKKLDELSVSKVAGSSLTSGGFNAAVEQIKADAKS